MQAGRWRTRYAAGELAAIERDLPRGGRKPTIDAAEIVRLTTQTKPEAATQWSTRTLAAVAGVSDTTIQRIWRTAKAHDILAKVIRANRHLSSTQNEALH